MTISVVEVLIR